MTSQRWVRSAIDVTGWELPFDLLPDRAVQIALDPESLSPAETQLVHDGDLVPTYVRWWLTVGERLHVEHGKVVTLSVKKARRLRAPQFTVVEFTFAELLLLLSEPQFQWGLGWGDASPAPLRYRGCIIPWLPYAAVVAGTDDEVNCFLTKCCPE